MGNSRARAVYEALLSDGFRRPQTDSGLESFIRAKYEQKKYIAREWIPPSPPKGIEHEWDKEIEEELESQKRKKKPASSTATVPEPAKASTPVTIPAPLPKPKVNPNSPKTSRSDSKRGSSLTSSSNNTSANSSDLLGLNSSLTSTSNNSSVNKSDSFDNFLSGDMSGLAPAPTLAASASPATTTPLESNDSNNLEKEEKDFFNQSINNGVTDKGKLTKDSILALYGMNTYAQPQPPQPVAMGFMPQTVSGFPPQTNPQAFPNSMAPMVPAAGPSQDQFFNFASGNQSGMFNRMPQQQLPPQGQQFMNFANHSNNFANFGGQQPAFGAFPSTNSYQQQINMQKLNEDNIKKIESLNFNNFK
jgi:stromal membrane-associated protein